MKSLTYQLLSVNTFFQRRGARRLINDAIYLRGLSEAASLTVPIQSPSVWARYEASPQLKTEVGVYFHNTSVRTKIYSRHVAG